MYLGDLENCGMGCLAGFEVWEKINYRMLAEKLRYWQPSIIMFSGNENQEKWKESGPHYLAKWLRKEGQVVQQSSRKLNDNSGLYIRAYFWAPSPRFMKKIFAIIEKENKKGYHAWSTNENSSARV